MKKYIIISVVGMAITSCWGLLHTKAVKDKIEGQHEREVIHHRQELEKIRAEHLAERTSWGEEKHELEEHAATLQTELANTTEIVDQLMADGTWHMLEGIATAYSPFDNSNGIQADDNPHVTSTGVAPGPGIIAVDPNKIPYGSNIIVIYPDGTRYRGTANDTGGALRSNPVPQVDIYRNTFKEAIAHGKQNVIILWSKK